MNKIHAITLWKIANTINEGGCRLPKTLWDEMILNEKGKIKKDANPYSLYEKIFGYLPDLADANDMIYRKLRPWVLKHYPQIIECFYAIEAITIYGEYVEITTTGMQVVFLLFNRTACTDQLQ